MMSHAIGYGLGTATRRPRLALTLWVWNLTIAAVVAFPAWRWWSDAFGNAPSTDSLLNRFDLTVLTDLTHYNRTSVFSVARSSLTAGIFVALLTNPLLVGGVLEILLTDDSRSFMHRFFRGAGHFFWRFLRMLAMSVVAGLIALTAVGAVLGLVLRPLSESSWEPGWVLAAILQLVVLGLVALWFYLALDYARIRVALDDSRRTLRAWAGALAFVCRRAFGTYAITVVIALLLLIVAGLYVGYSAAIPASTRATILLMLAVQQVFMIVRSGLRVAHLGAEVDYYRQARAIAPVGVAPAAAGLAVSEPAPPPVEVSTEPPAGGAAEPGGNGPAEGQAQ
jgi:hypothetical protein